MVALATAFVRLRLDVSKTKGDIDKGLREAGGEKAAEKKGRSISTSFSKGFEGGGSTFGRVAATMAARATLAASAVAAATPAVVQFVAALAPAAGVGAALPAVLGSLVTVAGTAKIAVIGVGNAISKGLGSDPKVAKKALDALHGSARVFAKDVTALKKPLDDIQRRTASKFFTPLINEIRPLANTYFPLFRKQLPQTASLLGQLGARVAEYARKGPAVRAINALFDAGQASLKRLKAAIGPVINALGNGLAATTPVVTGLSGGFASLLIRVSNFVNTAAKTGQLRGWITNGITVIRQLITIFANLGVITSRVFGSLTGGSTTLLARLIALTAQARRFVSSAQGSQVIVNLFQTLGVLGAALRRSLAGVLPQISASLAIAGPAAASLASALSRLLVAVAPLLPDLTRIAVQLITAVIPALNSMATWLERNQQILQRIAPVIVGFVIATRAVAVATGVAGIAVKAWSAAVGVAKVAQAGWTAIEWLAVAPKNANILATKISTSTMGTWIGVKGIEARAWLSGIAGSVRDTAAKVANRVATLASAAANRIMAGINMAGVWIASAVATARDTAAKLGNRIATLASAAAQNVAKVATLAWAAATNIAAIAMRAAGIALRFMSGPIGITITIIGLLVAAIIYLWKNNQTFRTIVLAVWAAVRNAIKAVGEWFTGTLVPLIKRGIDAGVIAFRLFQSAVRVVFAGVALYISTQVRVALSILRGLNSFVTGTVPAAFRAFQSAVRAVIAGVVSYIRGNVNVVISIFRSLVTFVTRTLPAGFASGVNAIRAAWSKVQDAARKPVSFVVNSVINPLISGYNKIAGIFGAPKAATIGGFAKGGRIPGAPSQSDNVLGSMVDQTGKFLAPLKVATGEFIVNARDTAKALPLLQWINSGMRGGPRAAAETIGRPLTQFPGDGSEGFAFAKGGLVGFLSNVWGALSDPTKLIKGPVQSAINSIPGSGFFHTMIVKLGEKLLSGLMKFASGGGGGTATGNVLAVQNFVRAQAGKPYVWASAGPGGYDCSGIVSAAYNLLKGRNPYSHTFSTESLPGPWFNQGAKVGPLVAGWSHPGQAPASASVGHMAGMIGGMPFESTGSTGVRVGFSARKVTQFANIGVARAHGGLVDTREVSLLDKGGRWPSGTLAANLSGNTEHVLTGGPNGDIADLKDILAAILAVLRGLGGDVAAALERPTRRAVQLGRGRGTGPVTGATS